MNQSKDANRASVQSIVHRLRAHAGTLHGPQNDDMRIAADIIELFVNQIQIGSCKMDSQHHWRFRHGWPMTHAIGATAEEAILAVVSEVDATLSRSGEMTFLEFGWSVAAPGFQGFNLTQNKFTTKPTAG